MTCRVFLQDGVGLGGYGAHLVYEGVYLHCKKVKRICDLDGLSIRGAHTINQLIVCIR